MSWFTGLEAALRPARMEGETHLPLQTSPIVMPAGCTSPGELLPQINPARNVYVKC